MDLSNEKSIRLEVDTVDQIFNAPDANPFSTNEVAVLGEAAIERLLVWLQAHPLRDWTGAELIVVLPPDQITPDLQTRLPEAIQRYCKARIADNHLQVRLSRQQHSFGLLMVTVISLFVMGLALLLVTTLLADASTLVQGMITAGASVFVWVIMWDPLEALLFDWAPPARENRVFSRLLEMNIVIQPRV